MEDEAGDLWENTGRRAVIGGNRKRREVHELWETIWTPERNGNIKRHIVFLEGRS